MVYNLNSMLADQHSIKAIYIKERREHGRGKSRRMSRTTKRKKSKLYTFTTVFLVVILCVGLGIMLYPTVSN